jgi:hypothetical protein
VSGSVIVICSVLFAAVGCVDATRPARDNLTDAETGGEPTDVSEPTDGAVEDAVSSDNEDDAAGSDTEASGEDGGTSDADTDGGGNQTQDTGCQDPGCACNYEGTTRGVCSEATTDSAGNCEPPSNYAADEQTCDDLDNDCDGEVDEGCDADGDGYCNAQLEVVGSPSVCPNGGGDCADQASAVNPGANEICDDNTDNDCDGNTDCDDPDCSGSRICNTGGTEKRCSDGRDNDRDGCTDCDDSDCVNQRCGPNKVCCPGLPTPGQCVSGTCVEKGQPCPR